MARNANAAKDMTMDIDAELTEEELAATEEASRGRQRQPKAPIRDFLNEQISTLQGVVESLDEQETDTEGQVDLFVENLRAIGQVGGRLRRVVKPYRAVFNPNLEDPDSEDEPYTEEDIATFWNDYRNEH